MGFIAVQATTCLYSEVLRCRLGRIVVVVPVPHLGDIEVEWGL